MKFNWKRELLLLLLITIAVVAIGRVAVGLIRYTHYRYQYTNCYMLNEEYFAEYGKAYFVEACGIDDLPKW